MKYHDVTQINEYLTAMRSERGIWYLRHKDLSGRMLDPYSLRFRGSLKELKKHLREKGIIEMVSSYRDGDMAVSVLSRFARQSTKIRLIDLVDKWIKYLRELQLSAHTLHPYETHVRRFLRMAGIEYRKPMDRAGLTTERISQYVNSVGYKRNYKKQALSAIRSFCTYLYDHSLITENPAGRAKVTKGLSHRQKETRKVVLFTDKEVELVLEHTRKMAAREEALVRDSTRRFMGSNKPDKYERWERYERDHNRRLRLYNFLTAATLLGWHFGLRISDCCLLEKECLLDPEYLTVWTLKKDVRVSFPLTPQRANEVVQGNPVFQRFSPVDKENILREFSVFGAAVEEISGLVPDLPGPYCWPEQAKQIKDKTLRNRPSKYFGQCCRACGIDGPTFHSLRHGRAMKWRSLGLDYDTIADLLAHASTASTKYYAAG